MLYALAQKRCGNFGTCGGADGITGTAAVNDAVLELIMTGSDYLLRGECTEAADTKEKIVNLMAVPLVQAVLRYVWSYAEGFLSRARDFTTSDRWPFLERMSAHVHPI